MKDRRGWIWLLTLAGALSAPSSALAQNVREQVPHDHVLSANPFALLYEWFNADYERRVSDGASVALIGSWISLDSGDEDYVSLNAQYRFYPQGAALSGFYFGPKLGFYRVDDGSDDGVAFGLGFDLGYQWLMGERENVAVALGIGATRLFGGDLDDFSVTVPTVRLVNIGWAF